MERKEDLINSTWLDLCIFSAKAFLTTRRLFRASPPIPSEFVFIPPLQKSSKFSWRSTNCENSYLPGSLHLCELELPTRVPYGVEGLGALPWLGVLGLFLLFLQNSSKSQKWLFIYYWKFIRTSNHRNFSRIQDFYSPLIFNAEILLSNLGLFSVCQRIAEDSNLVDRCLNRWNGKKIFGEKCSCSQFQSGLYGALSVRERLTIHTDRMHR